MYFLICVLLLSDIINGGLLKKFKCGYKQCPPTRDGALNVHLIPHSHMDAGWVKSFDEYYYGTRTSVSSANIQLIYHSVLSELLHDKRRRFILSETSYFWRWWKEQRSSTRTMFRNLVKEGRIEFSGGGWVQNDELTVDYLAVIDQFTWGLRKLNDTLGPCGKPKTAWQVDSYGHSKEQVSLIAQMGFDGLFIGRVDYKQREHMMEENRMEFIWRGSDVLGKMSDIMTHTLFNLYNAPDGFCFDFLCNEEPIVDDVESSVYNLPKRISQFISIIEKQAKYYDHDNIMLTMGGDFTYQSAANWYFNMDKLISHITTDQNLTDINIFYSTPSCYMKALYLHGRRDKGIFTEKGDHLPYGSDSNTYWTGFYTSRPTLKYFAKQAHMFLQVMKQLTVISQVVETYELHLLRHAVSLMLHHDITAGTIQQRVASDIYMRLSSAIEACTAKITTLLGVLIPTWGINRRGTRNGDGFVICHQLNISQCKIAETSDSLILLVYNPSSVKVYHYIRLPALAFKYSIRDGHDDEIDYQLVPMVAASINIPGRKSTAVQELYFEAENIPPIGYAAYYITPIHDLRDPEAKKEQKEKDPNFIYNEFYRVTINRDTGLLESIQQTDGVNIKLTQYFKYYSQSQQQTLHSGAYSFRPSLEPIDFKEFVVFEIVQGPLLSEIHQKFSDWITQVIRLYRAEDFVEFEWTIGPVPVGSDVGKEVVTRFKTNISNNGDFLTDSNGRQMMRRNCWTKSTNGKIKKALPSCYYPVTSKICIQSQNSSEEMCILTDRAQGGTSYEEGEIELMLHRRLLTDDGFGLEETLNEEAFGVGLVVKGKHRLILGDYKQETDELTFSEKVSYAARRWSFEPWYFISSGDKMNRMKWQTIRNKKYSSLKLRGLPNHIQIITLEPWKGGSVLLRLENTLEIERVRNKHKSDKYNEEYIETKLSRITVDLRKIFLQLKIRSLRETTLAANQWLDEARQMDWSTRYIYNGGDDDIPDDNIDYSDDKMSQPTKSVQDDTFTGYASSEEIVDKIIASTEASELNQRKKNRYPRRKKYEEYYREKRNANYSDIVADDHVAVTGKNKVRKNSKGKNIKYAAISNDGQDIEPENYDDQITKPMYEMYYKHKPKQNKRKKISEERPLRDEGSFEIDNLKIDDFVFGLYDDRQKEDINYTSVYDEDYSILKSKPEERYQEEVRKRTKRNYRSSRRADPESDFDEEYVVTLRPTQIRTFVIWFDSPKKFQL